MTVTIATITTLVHQFREVYKDHDLYETKLVGEMTHDALHVYLGLDISPFGEQCITSYHFAVIGIPFYLVPPIEELHAATFSDEEWCTLWEWYKKGLALSYTDSDWDKWLKKYNPLPLFEISEEVEEGIKTLECMIPEHASYVKEVMIELGFN